MNIGGHIPGANITRNKLQLQLLLIILMLLKYHYLNMCHQLWSITITHHPFPLMIHTQACLYTHTQRDTPQHPPHHTHNTHNTHNMHTTHNTHFSFIWILLPLHFSMLCLFILHCAQQTQGLPIHLTEIQNTHTEENWIMGILWANVYITRLVIRPVDSERTNLWDI